MYFTTLSQKATRKTSIMRRMSRENSDVLGSYTGTPRDGLRPVQDADDL